MDSDLSGSSSERSGNIRVGTMSWCTFLPPLSSVSFEDKIKFSASQDLALARSKLLISSETENQSDKVGMRPPDFSVRFYKSLKVPQRKDKKMPSNVARPQQTKRTRIVIPKILHSSYQMEEPRKFITHYKPPDILEAELRFVRTGKFPAASYKNPKPHDFRPVSLCINTFFLTFSSVF